MALNKAKHIKVALSDPFHKKLFEHAEREGIPVSEALRVMGREWISGTVGVTELGIEPTPSYVQKILKRLDVHVPADVVEREFGRVA